MRRRLRHGFTLMELLVGFALVGLVIAMGLLQLRSATRNAESRGLAEEIAEELRLARQRAMSSNSPIAIAFPSAAGGSAHVQSLYVLEGQNTPIVTQAREFQGDYPNAFAFLGHWPVTGVANSVDTAAVDTHQDWTAMQTWLAQIPSPLCDKDYLLIFTPSGRILSNGWCHYEQTDGAQQYPYYHILVGEGITYAATAAPAGNPGPAQGSNPISHFQASAVASPYTVAISPAGEITVQTGVPSALGLSTAGDRIAMGPPPRPTVPSVANVNPTLVSVTADPQPVTPRPDGSAVVPPNGYLTLRLLASEPHQALSCVWTASDGTLSSSEPTRMDFDRTLGQWVAEWVWSPPEGAAPDQKFDLAYTVDDGAGGVLTGQLGTSGEVTVGSQGTIAYGSWRPSDYEEIVLVQPDGVGPKLLTPEGDGIFCSAPAWQPGGNQLAFLGFDDNRATVEQSLYIINRDGSGLKPIVDLTSVDDFMNNYDYFGNSIGPSWSYDGLYLTYAVEHWDAMMNTEISVWIVRADGSGATRLTSPGINFEDYNPIFSPDGQWVVFHREDWNGPGSLRLCRVPSVGGAVEFLTPLAGVGSHDPAYAPDGSAIYYIREDWAGPGTITLHKMNPDGSGQAPVYTAPGAAFLTRPVVSPDGTLIAFIQDEFLAVTTASGLNPDTMAPGAKIVSTSPDPVVNFAWSPDSANLVYSDDIRVTQTNVLGPPQSRQLSGSSPIQDSVPTWSP